jgi:hypothetical protein
MHLLPPVLLGNLRPMTEYVDLSKERLGLSHCKETSTGINPLPLGILRSAFPIVAPNDFD